MEVRVNEVAFPMSLSVRSLKHVVSYSSAQAFMISSLRAFDLSLVTLGIFYLAKRRFPTIISFLRRTVNRSARLDLPQADVGQPAGDAFLRVGKLRGRKMQIARKIYVRIIIPQSVVRAAAAARPAGGERIHRFAVERMTFEERLHYARRVAPPDGVADENRGAVIEIFRLACDRGAGVGVVLLTASAAAAVRIIEIGGGVRRFWNDLIQRTARFFGNRFGNTLGVSRIGKIRDQNISGLRRGRLLVRASGKRQ